MLVRNLFNRMLVAAAIATSAATTSWANNVQVALEGSLLVVRGDNAANDISLTQNSVGTIVVRGRNGTLVNGLASVTFPRVALNAAEVLMEGGNDIVVMSGLSPANDLFVNLGEGNDRFTSTNPAIVGANATIEGAAGNDIIRCSNLLVFEDLYIDGGIGTLNATLTNVICNKGIAVIADDLNDRVTISGCSSADFTAVETKKGNDNVNISTSDVFSLAANTDEGTDIVSITDVNVTEDVGIFTGMGNDRVTMDALVSGKSLTVSVDGGADSVIASNVLVSEDAVFEGGAGFDVFQDLGVFAGIKKDIKEFESLLQ